MQQLIDVLLEKLKNDGFEYVFTKVHEDNIASNKSCYNKGFKKWCHYTTPVNKTDFEYLSSQPFFCKQGKINASKTLEKFKDNEEIIVEYNILVQKLY